MMIAVGFEQMMTILLALLALLQASLYIHGKFGLYRKRMMGMLMLGCAFGSFAGMPMSIN